MTADVRSATAARAPGISARLIGFGSIFGKTVRDGRGGAIAAAGFVSVMMLVGAAALAAEWPTAQQRLELLASIELLPIFLRGLLGDPIAIDTLGGFLSWRFGNILPVMVGLWSVMALSGTLALEAQRGSLDLLASTPVGRRRIASEKVAGHLVLLTLAMIVGAIATTIAGAALGTVAGDEIAFDAALAHFALTGLLVLAAGSLAFALAPLLGRGRAAAIGALALFGGYLIVAYRSIAPVLDALEPISWYAWTAGHRPLAGVWDWPAVLLLAAVCAGLLVAGVVAFERRDIGVALSFGRFRLPGLPAGTAGPFARQLADRAGLALGAGLGIGIYGLLIAASARELSEAFAGMPGIDDLLARLFPGMVLSDPSGILQLAFFVFGSVLLALASAALVGGWAGDETDNRIDFVLSTPLARLRWFLASSLGVFAAIALLTSVATALIAVGVLVSEGDPLAVLGGGVVLALIGMAFAAVGLAVGGLGRPGRAGGVAGGLAIGSYLLSLLGNALRLPDWLVDLSLHEHLGQPMIGRFDEVGLVAMAVLIVGGVAVGGWGFVRRDLGR